VDESNAESDELGAVQQAFNAMLEEIGERDLALQAYQVDLERQVLARTQELSAAVERNQAILDSAGEGIFGLDLAGTVTFMNPSAARILGGDISHLVGRSLHAHIHCATCPDRPLPYHQCKVCGAHLKPAMRAGRGKFARFDGGLVPIEYTSATIVDADGAATGVVVTFRDISERLAVERMKDEFVSTVSHELRTPLTAIRGAIGLLGAGLLGTASPKGKRMLDIALSNTDRLGRLINDILDLEKMESGRVELHRKSGPIADLLKQAAEAMQPMADRTGIRISVHAAPADLLVDPDRIQQMVINLISNAIKFSPSNTAIDVTGRIGDDAYVITVRDEGRGIPEDKLETIFERFKQVDASDSRDKGGTGLGLAICRSIAQAHSGKIWARRAEPAGSVFTFTLPMPRPAQAAARVDALIIEDDFDLARVLVAALEESGIHAEHAATGRDAIEALSQRVPSLVVLDVALPEGDGFGVVGWMRDRPQLARVPVLVYSARELSEVDRKRLTLGPTEFVVKSRASIEELEARVARLLFARQQALSTAAAP
jgi:PAS domain S-box-containing protein